MSLVHWLLHPLYKGCNGSNGTIRSGSKWPHPGHIPATSPPHPWRHPGHIHGNIRIYPGAPSMLRAFNSIIVESQPSHPSYLGTESNSISRTSCSLDVDGGMADGLHLHVATFASLRCTRVVVTTDHGTECNHLHHAWPLFDRFPTLDPVTRALLAPVNQPDRWR